MFSYYLEVKAASVEIVCEVMLIWISKHVGPSMVLHLFMQIIPLYKNSQTYQTDKYWCHMMPTVERFQRIAVSLEIRTTEVTGIVKRLWLDFRSAIFFCQN